jgi:hypothetical protein
MGKIPSRIFLDTSVINFIVEHAELIFDGYYHDDNLNVRVRMDIFALYQIFEIARRNPIEIVVSKTNFEEILRTNDREKRSNLLSYCTEIWHYFKSSTKQEFEISEKDLKLAEGFLKEKDFLKITDQNDRRLLLESLYFKCDHFCTRDWRTILKHRELVTQIPIKIITPWEWWEKIEGVIDAPNKEFEVIA